MRQLWIICMLLISGVGCNRPEKKSLLQLLNAIDASLGHNYDHQLKGLPKPEANIRFRVLFSNDPLAAVDAYLAGEPPISKAGKQVVEEYRASLAADRDLFERLLAEKRYEPTEDEKKQDAHWRSLQRKNLETIGRIVDG